MRTESNTRIRWGVRLPTWVAHRTRSSRKTRSYKRPSGPAPLRYIAKFGPVRVYSELNALAVLSFCVGRVWAHRVSGTVPFGLADDRAQRCSL